MSVKGAEPPFEYPCIGLGGYHVKRSMALDTKIKYGPVAQLAERQTHNLRVAGS